MMFTSEQAYCLIYFVENSRSLRVDACLGFDSTMNIMMYYYLIGVES
jgi:hypothetical protein